VREPHDGGFRHLAVRDECRLYFCTPYQASRERLPARLFFLRTGTTDTGVHKFSIFA
jgi:hypothetical protein